ncbi:MAG: DUF1254 domain-containing protein [Acidovorax sp.]
MKHSYHRLAYAAALVLPLLAAAQQPAQLVTVDNFVRAETDRYMAGQITRAGLGKFHATRTLAPVDRQAVVRMNRDTLYASAVLDLDASPATIVMPDAGKRYLSAQVLNEDHYTTRVVYTPGSFTLTRQDVGTRYAYVIVRILVDGNDPQDLKQVHVLQDALQIKQAAPGKFEVPNWDEPSRKKVRDALVTLANTTPDTRTAFGAEGAVNPIRRLVWSAAGWGGLPDKDAVYLNFTPARNDGKTVHRLTLKDVPIDGFWSVSVYNAQGYYEKNAANAYVANSVSSAKAADGSVTVQFGDCDDKVPNCLPIVPGWNYLMRLYLPHAEILNGKWQPPEAQAVD